MINLTSTSLIVILFLLWKICCNSNKENVCRVLVLGGGGDRGSWQGGAIKALVEFLEPKYKIVAGTSIGGINAGLFAQSKVGEEKKGSACVENYWNTIKRDEMYTNWPLGPIEGLITKPSLFNTEVAVKSTFYKYLNVTAFHSSDRLMFLGSTNYGSGEAEIFNKTFCRDILPICAAASSAIPGLFPPIKINNQYYTDGGTSNNSPVCLPISKCKEYFPGEKIIVDVVYCVSRIRSPKLLLDYMLIPFVLVESLVGIINELLLNDLQYAKEAFPEAEINVYTPQEHLESLFISFDHNELVKMFNTGYDETKKKITGRK